MERRAGVTMVEGDAGLADYILCEAFRRTPADKRSQVGNFLTLRTEIVGTPPPTEIVHPIYAEMAAALEHEPARGPAQGTGDRRLEISGDRDQSRTSTRSNRSRKACWY